MKDGLFLIFVTIITLIGTVALVPASATLLDAAMTSSGVLFVSSPAVLAILSLKPQPAR